MTGNFIAVSVAVFLSLAIADGQLSATSLSIPSYKNSGEMGAIISGTILKPEGTGPFPTVILMHGCSGLNRAVSIGLQNHAAYLVENGYAALILDSFTGRGKSDGVCSSYGELANARDYRVADAYNTLSYLRSLPYVDQNNFFLMGQSNGGSVALIIASQINNQSFQEGFKFNAIVAFYPWCGALVSKPKIPLLVLGGERDDWTPLGPCFSAQKQNLNSPYKVIEYKNAHHSFDLFISVQSYSGHTIGGDENAREDSRKQMLKWFETYRY